MPTVRLLEQAGVCLKEFIEELAHTLGGLDVRVGLRDILRLLHARPRQEEREVLIDLADREPDRLARLSVGGDHLVVVGDDDESRAESHHIGRRLQFLEYLEGVATRLLEIDDLLLRDLGGDFGSDVQVAVAQARDAALRLAVGE
ncbi:hypothetical protein IF188_06860 [Microbacterium sp. NEAU-LLC]|uniref:Uncharacterized protein n=1 Tax=Microbacterium helvum TaxID=2773713 RepID=A0ABR8NL67_9MICO|nr:hypothetical protein [Microbacterium helvum]